WTTAEDEFVLDAVADHMGRLRRADLAATCHPAPLAVGLEVDARRRERRELLNNRKGQSYGAIECSVGQRDYRCERQPVPVGA
ncbi:MAG: hypothetical protein ACXWZ5_14520, partial [Mycobacterium sp.]